MDQLLVLTLIKIILPQDQILAPSTALRIRYGVHIALHIYLPFRVVEVCQLTIVIHVNADFIEGGASAELAEQPIYVHVDSIAALAKQFESFNPRQDPAIEVKKLESHLNDYILHGIIRGYELNEIHF